MVTPQTLERAAKVASEGVNPLPQTAYKVALLERTVLGVLERTAARL